MAKYKILMLEANKDRTIADNFEQKEVEVDGEPVHFAGFEAFTFFSHKSAIEDRWGMWDDHRITELSSGCSIGGGFTLEEAMAKAHQNLSTKTPESLQHMIDTVKGAIKNGS